MDFMSRSSNYQLDLDRLLYTVDQVRRHRGITERQVMREVGCSPSTYTRMKHGLKPDADALLSLLGWLGHDVKVLYATANGQPPAESEAVK
jgi:transcriptional regulator with XRE-family HTH domain